MVESACLGPSVQSQTEVDLTDDQIQRLLLEAESRLCDPNVQLTKDSDAASLRYVEVTLLLLKRSRATGSPLNRIPKLSSGTSLEPYVRQGDQIATVDSAQLMDPKQKVLSNSLRTLHTKRLNKVCLHFMSFSPSLCYEENFSQRVSA